MNQFTEAKKTADHVCQTVRALLPKWQAWFPNERSEVEIPRCDLLLLVDAVEHRDRQCEVLADGISHALSMISDIHTRHPEIPDEGFKELDAIRVHLLGTLIGWKCQAVNEIMPPSEYHTLPAEQPREGGAQ